MVDDNVIESETHARTHVLTDPSSDSDELDYIDRKERLRGYDMD